MFRALFLELEQAGSDHIGLLEIEATAWGK
jgi:hypothetical protein